MTPFADLHHFLRSHAQAWQFADIAREDYLLARLGMPMGLWSSFPMACQSIEKLLKAYLLFRDDTLNQDQGALRRRIRDRDGRTGHELQVLMLMAEDKGLTLPSESRTFLERYESHFDRRYPPEIMPNYRTQSGGSVKDLDALVFQIWDHFKDIHPEYYYCCGIMRDVYGEIVDPKEGFTYAGLTCLVYNNEAFRARRDEIVFRIKELIAQYFPSKRDKGN